MPGLTPLPVEILEKLYLNHNIILDSNKQIDSSLIFYQAISNYKKIVEISSLFLDKTKNKDCDQHPIYLAHHHDAIARLFHHLNVSTLARIRALTHII